MIENFEKYSDEWLVNRYQEGDQDALSVLIKRYHPKLIRAVRFQTHGNGPVEDIAQESWYSIIKKLSEINLKISFNAWATTVARHKAIDWLRKKQRIQKKEDAFASEEDNQNDDDLDEQKKLEKIHFEIQYLSPAQQVILKMFYVENLTLEEISKVLDISVGTVKSRLFHAREKLKEMITK